MKLAIRRRVAERLSKVKERTGLKTPVLDEVPLKAKSISQEAYLQLERIRDRDVLERLRLPTIVRGKAYGETAGRWYKVTFPHPVYDANVVAVAEGRKGDRPRAKDVPTISELKEVLKEKIPDLTIPKLEVYFPTRDEVIAKVKDWLGDWGWANWMRDAIAYAEGSLGWWMGNTFIRPAIEKVYGIITILRDRINDRLTKIRGIFNTKLSDIDDRFETLRSRAEDSLKTLFPRLYDAWGQRRDMILTVAQIRNVTNTGFEFLSMGETTVHYFAMGTRR